MIEPNNIDKFRQQLQTSCVSMRPLRVTEVKPGLHEKAEGITRRPVYYISWQRQPMSLLGRFRLAYAFSQSAKFLKLDARRLKMPTHCSKCYALAQNSPQKEEVAIFLDTRLGSSRLSVMLAVRVAEQWFELCRWNTSWEGIGHSWWHISDI